ncbi:hypothetical protein BaRGS_00028576 [Batillaria attramentaria]|uniref:Uncharacterized protein n=1 Tax=Batillaria attramentaria TaxID=370345 RepID=A0ABD0JZJ6_9CAEN
MPPLAATQSFKTVTANPAANRLQNGPTRKGDISGPTPCVPSGQRHPSAATGNTNGRSWSRMNVVGGGGLVVPSGQRLQFAADLAYSVHQTDIDMRAHRESKESRLCPTGSEYSVPTIVHSRMFDNRRNSDGKRPCPFQTFGVHPR